MIDCKGATSASEGTSGFQTHTKERHFTSCMIGAVQTQQLARAPADVLALRAAGLRASSILLLCTDYSCLMGFHGCVQHDASDVATSAARLSPGNKQHVCMCDVYLKFVLVA